MGFLDVLYHLLNFFVPAFGVAVLTVLVSAVLMKRSSATPGLLTQAAINFVVCSVVLVVGLWLFGRDGKIATYAALVLVCATSQAWMLRGR
jgi:hypothetical protein